MSQFRFRMTVTGAELKAALAADRAADAITDALCASLEKPAGLGLEQELRHLAGQVRRQHELPRDGGRDGRFLLHLEHALRDLAVRGAGAP